MKCDSLSISAFRVQKTTKNPKMDDDCSSSLSEAPKIIEITEHKNIFLYNESFIGN